MALQNNEKLGSKLEKEKTVEAKAVSLDIKNRREKVQDYSSSSSDVEMKVKKP